MIWQLLNCLYSKKGGCIIESYLFSYPVVGKRSIYWSKCNCYRALKRPNLGLAWSPSTSLQHLPHNWDSFTSPQMPYGQFVLSGPRIRLNSISFDRGHSSGAPYSPSNVTDVWYLADTSSDLKHISRSTQLFGPIESTSLGKVGIRLKICEILLVGS